VIVVDAGVLATALADDGPAGAAIRDRLQGDRLTAPALLDLEVTSVLRRLVRSGQLSEPRAGQALDDLHDLPLERVLHTGPIARCWELRDNLTVYDASYVAVAELFDARLVTGDARLARAPGPRCDIELLTIRSLG
jgi:predicted nucleic acid-binding protein